MKRWTARSILVALTCALLLVLPHTTASVTLRVGTYNIMHMQLGKFDIASYASMIRGAKLDVLCLQEVDYGTSRSGGRDEAKLLADALGWHYAFAPAIQLDEGEYGLAILSRYPIEELSLYRFKTTDAEQRILAQVAMTVNSTTVYILNTHLSPDLHDPAAGLALRKEQFAELSAVLQPLPNYILAGDLNTNTPAELAQVSGTQWANVTEIAHITYPASNAAIDNIGIAPGAIFSNITAIPSNLSDHFLFCADVTIFCGN